MDPATISPTLLKQDKGPLLVIIIWFFASLALVVVSIKVWTRLKVLRKPGLEDLFVLLAWILSLVYGAILTASVRSGLGQHAYALEPFAVMTAIRLYAAGIPFGILSVALPACAIAIILEKITAPSKRQVRFLYGVPALNIVIKIGNVILVYTTCPPADTQRFFKLSTACVSRYVVIYYLYISTCFSAATAVFLTVWPMVAFWKLQLKTKTKAILLLLFSTTAIAAACALVRVGNLPKLEQYNDFTYSAIDYTIWVVIEGDVFIIAACVPGLRPFVNHLRKNIHRPKRFQGSVKEMSNLSPDTLTPSPPSLRRMEPRSSGSVSDGLQPPPRVHHQACRQKDSSNAGSGARDVEKQHFEKWQEMEDEKWRDEEKEAPMEDFLGVMLRHDDLEAKERRVRLVALSTIPGMYTPWSPRWKKS